MDFMGLYGLCDRYVLFTLAAANIALPEYVNW